MSRSRRLGQQAAEAFADVPRSAPAAGESTALTWWHWPAMASLQWQIFCWSAWASALQCLPDFEE